MQVRFHQSKLCKRPFSTPFVIIQEEEFDDSLKTNETFMWMDVSALTKYLSIRNYTFYLLVLSQSKRGFAKQKLINVVKG